MPVKLITFFLLFTLSTSVLAMPKINVNHQRNNAGFAEVQVTNNTVEKLICHVAINGHKLRFHLQALGQSKWYTATDKQFNHSHFSIWCDYLRLHPKYQK